MAPPKNKKKKTEVIVKDPKVYYHKPFEFNFVRVNDSKPFQGEFMPPKFEAILANQDHIYVLYVLCGFFELKMTRFCKITHCWEEIEMKIKFTQKIYSSSFLWDNTTIVLLCSNRIHVFDTTTLTWSKIDITQLSTRLIPDGMAINFPTSASVNFGYHALDKVNQRIYAMVTFDVNHDDQFIYCYDWQTKQWTLVADSNQNVPSAAYMAYNDGHLYVGALGLASNANLAWKKTYKQVARIDLATRQLTLHTIKPFRVGKSKIILPPRSKMRWAQVGSTVYGVGALIPCFSSRSIVNDLWSIDLPTLTWKRHQQPAQLKVPMEHYRLIGSDGPNAELWLWTRSTFHRIGHIFAYQISLSVPRLHSLARSAFFFRRPDTLAYPMRIKTRQKDRKNRPLVVSANRVRQFFQEEGFNPAIFKLPNPIN